MTCYHSKPAWQSTLPDENGVHHLQFAFRTDRAPDYFIPCGKCLGCRADQARDWGVRIFHEAQMYDQNAFVTLTYDDDHIPDDGKINREDLQLFFKRLRHYLNTPIRYFACGEYGEKTKRPHYHAIFFGHDFRGGRYTYKFSNSMYGNKQLDKIWGKGTITLKTVHSESAFYAAGYCAKKIGDTDTFSLQSRRPPIGRTWLDKHKDNIRRLESIQIDGQRYPVPQVYHNWLKGDDTFAHLKENLRANAVLRTDKQLRSKKLHHQSRNNLRNHKI